MMQSLCRPFSAIALRVPRVARVVEIHHVHGQLARRCLEAAPHVGANESEPVQRYAGCLIEIGERDPITSRLGSSDADPPDSDQSTEEG
jgi:hypothetical protein